MSACVAYDAEALSKVKLCTQKVDKADYDFEKRKEWLAQLDIVRAPPPPLGAREGDIWVIYTGSAATGRVQDAHFFGLRKQRWVHFMNMGSAPAALKWHNFESGLRQAFLQGLPNPF